MTQARRFPPPAQSKWNTLPRSCLKSLPLETSISLGWPQSSKTRWDSYRASIDALISCTADRWPGGHTSVIGLRGKRIVVRICWRLMTILPGFDQAHARRHRSVCPLDGLGCHTTHPTLHLSSLLLIVDSESGMAR